MKKLVLIIVFTTFLAFSLNSFPFMFKISLSNVKYILNNNNSDIKNSFLPTIKLGIMATLKLNKSIKLLPAILLGTIGSKCKIYYSDEEFLTGKYTALAISFPLDFTYLITKNIIVFLGPELYYLLSHRLLLENDDHFNLINNSPNIQLAVNLGIGYKYSGFRIPILFQIGYNYLFTNIFNGIESKSHFQSFFISLNIGLKNRDEK